MHCHLVNEWHNGLGVPLARGTVGIYSCRGHLWGQDLPDDVLPLLSTRGPQFEPELGALKLVGKVEDLGSSVIGLTGVLSLVPDIVSDAVGMSPLRPADPGPPIAPPVNVANSTPDPWSASTTEVTPIFAERSDRAERSESEAVIQWLEEDLPSTYEGVFLAAFDVDAVEQIGLADPRVCPMNGVSGPAVIS